MNIRPEMLRNARSYHPSWFSDPELDWLIEKDNEGESVRLGLSPQVIQSQGFPEGVNPVQVMPVIERIHEIITMNDAGVDQGEFVGVDNIRKGFSVYRDDQKKEEEAKRRNPLARRARMGAFALAGRFHIGLVGGDSDFVRSRFVRTPEGLPKKVPYEIMLFVNEHALEWIMDEEDPSTVGQPENPLAAPIAGRFEITLDQVNKTGSIKNPIDGHTEVFVLGQGKSGSIRGCWNKHRKHCFESKSNVDMHHALEKMIDVQMAEGAI